MVILRGRRVEGGSVEGGSGGGWLMISKVPLIGVIAVLGV